MIIELSYHASHTAGLYGFVPHMDFCPKLKFVLQSHSNIWVFLLHGENTQYYKQIFIQTKIVCQRSLI